MGRDFDPRMTFDTFVVGPANRLAAAAARRVAESPGAGYNPLFLYSASGLGKSHILSAIAEHAVRHDSSRPVLYQTLEGYLDELAQALERGGPDSVRDRYTDLAILLLDDVQFLTGQAQAQEMLLRTLDTLTGSGAQVVLASDRPPAEINGLDARLLSRFSGGLIVDIGPPDYETRVAIMRRKSDERGVQLSPGVAEAMARFPFRNVRELQGALNRLLVMQDLEGRAVTEEDLAGLMGEGFGRSGVRFSDLLERLPEGGADSGESSAAPVAPPAPDAPRWRREVHALVDEARRDGFRVERLVQLLRETEEPDGWEQTLSHLRKQFDRLRQIRTELDQLGNPWTEAAMTLLVDPGRLEEAESLLQAARERARPFPALPEGPELDELDGRFPALALRSAELLIRSERPDFNPLYVYSADPERPRRLLEATGRSYLALAPEGKVGLLSVPEFSDELIRALSDGIAGAWRERWWSVELLLLYGIEALASTERAQEEFFHLFEALQRRGARILLSADRPPSEISGVDDRLRSRFEGGLVVDLGGTPAGVRAPAPPKDSDSPDRVAVAPATDTSEGWTPILDPGIGESDRSEPGDAETLDDLSALRELAGLGRGRGQVAAAAGDQAQEDVVVRSPAAEATSPAWFPSPEKIVWHWPSLGDRIEEEDTSDGD